MVHAQVPLTAVRGFTSWRLDVPTLIVVGLLGAGYLVGARLASRRGERWPVPRTAAFLGLGLGSIVLVTMSSLGVYSGVLFWPRAVQYAVLLGLTPLLLALGEPVELARRCLTGSRRRQLDVVLRGRIAKVLTFPLIGALLGMSALLCIYLTPLYRSSLTEQPVHLLLELALVLIGCLFFLPQLTQDILPDWCGYSLRTAFAFLDSLLDALPGVVIMTMKGTIAADYYRGLHRNWGPTLHWDQTTGGALMFTLTEAVAVPYLIALFIRWVREDEEDTKRIDRELDQAITTDAGDQPLTTRPWWETDPGPMAERAAVQRDRRRSRG